jgi:hypothetical protein
MWLTWNPRDNARPRERLPRHFLQSITLRPIEQIAHAETRVIDVLRIGGPTWSATDGPLAAVFRRRSVQSSSKRVEGWGRAIPAQLVHVVEERDVSLECSESPKKQCALPFAAKSACGGARVGGVHAPRVAIRRNGFDMEKLGEDGSRGLPAPLEMPVSTM